LERFRFGADVAFAPREELLEGVTVAPLSRSIFHGSPFQAAVFRVAPGGRIARHPATYPQIMAVLDVRQRERPQRRRRTDRGG